MSTRTKLLAAQGLIAPVVGSLCLAIERKQLKRSQVEGSIAQLRKAIEILEGI